MRTNCRLLLAVALLALCTRAFAQDPNPTPPPPMPPSEATPPPLPEPQSTVPTVAPTESAPAPTSGTPAATLTPTKVLGVDTSVVLGRQPTPKTLRAERKASALTAAKKRGDKDASKTDASKTPEAAAAAVAAFSDAAAPPPPPSALDNAGAPPPQAADIPPAPAAGAVQNDANAAKAESQTQDTKGGGVWILFAIFVVAAIGMATYIGRRSNGVKELSIFPGGTSSRPRSPLVSGRHF